MISGLDCHALVIGINGYSGGIRPLQCAVRDATSIAEMLQKDHDYSVTRLLDDEATGNAIKHYLTETLPPKLSERSAFVLYFAGHGDARGDGTQGPQGYLLPHDASKSDEENWLSMSELRKALRNLACRHLLVILDCCFAGAFRWTSTRGSTMVMRPLYQSQFERYLREGSWQALTSAAYDERAADAAPGRHNRRDENTVAGHSPFAVALMKGLQGEADSSRGSNKPDGVITATELHQYVFEELTSEDAKLDQTPGIWPLKADNKGEFVFMNPSTDNKPEPDPPLTDESNPWLGLKTYSSKDTPLFFGRQRVVDVLLKKIMDDNAPSLLAVVGASGTGKSSVVKAGLLPLLISPSDEQRESIGKWLIVRMPRLSGDPNTQLDESLIELQPVTAGHRRLLFVDQFEELYTQCPDDALRQRFLQRLRDVIDADDGPLVLVTLRSDFEPRPRGSDALKTLWSAARYVVPAFSVEELRDIIEGPAEVMAMFFESDELVGELLDEIMAMPGALPLLSFALAEMYRYSQVRRRETGATDRALTQDDYDKTGGVVGALHKRATLLYEEAADDNHRATIRRLFLRLVSQDAGITRRRVANEELIFADDTEQRRVDSVKKTFVDGRLLVTDGGFVEPAHDTLVVAWDKLQDWLGSSGSQGIIRAVWRDASEWNNHRNDKHAYNYLWHNDPRLPQAKDKTAELNKLELVFVAASSRQKKKQGLLKIAMAAAAFIAISVAIVVSVAQKKISDIQIAETNYATGRALLEQARQQLRDKDHFSAAMLAAEVVGFRGYGVSESVENTETLPVLIDASKLEYDTLVQILTSANTPSFRPLAWRALGFVTYSRSSNVLAGVSERNTIEVWNLDTGQLAELSLPEKSADNWADLVISDDGSRLAAVGRDSNQILMWLFNEDSLEPMPVTVTPPFGMNPTSAVFSDDGSRFAAFSGKYAVIWSLETQIPGPTDPPMMFHREKDGQRSLTFTPGGNEIISGGWHNKVTAIGIEGICSRPASPPDFEVTAGCSQNIGPHWGWERQWPEHKRKGDHIRAIEFSPDKKILAVASANRVLISEVNDRAARFKADVFYQVRYEITAMKFAPSGKSIAVSSEDGVDIVAYPEGDVIAHFMAHRHPSHEISRLNFSPDGSLLIYGDSDRMEIRDTAFLSSNTFSLDVENFDAIMPSSDDQPYLRKLIDDRLFDFAGTINRVTEGETPGEDLEIGEVRGRIGLYSSDSAFFELAAQKRRGDLLAIGTTVFANKGRGIARIDVFSASTQKPMFSFLLDEDVFGFRSLYFSEDESTLLAWLINFDGGFAGAYQWPTTLPDLVAYMNGSDCQAPINLRSNSLLANDGVLQCAPEITGVELP